MYSYEHASNVSEPDETDLLAAGLRRERLRPATAGALSGIVGGGIVAAALYFCDPALVGFVVSTRWLVRFDVVYTRPAAAAALVVTCAIVGALFASVTRRLRRFSHAALWSVTFFSSVWICAGAVIAKRAPHLTSMLPFLPLLAVTAAFALALALHVPLRGRR